MNLVLQWRDSGDRDMVTKEVDFWKFEYALGWLDDKAKGMKVVKEKSKLWLVFIYSSARDEQIVELSEHKV